MTINGTPSMHDVEHDTLDSLPAEVESLDAEKGPQAFRTISEVADELHVPQHTLRLWETQFHQVRPLKRGGGRRYYRPDDVALLSQIADLIYTQGYTVKGVQRLLQERPLAPQSDMQTFAANGVEEAPVAVEPAMIESEQDVPVVTDCQQIETVAAQLPAAVEAGLEQALVQIMGQNVRLRSDLSDVLVELEAIRRKILA
ncbi:MerR family transcriptional regulator [Acetobacter syzygii]|uniref:MerR family transcriptional regulator n=1 Tax=Acetobacter syzygii TaxID=146476 RepID=UPI00156F53FA|nr:MerR family transcriptional regulator [Acetobacter syzygii]NSL93316.1 MerR family transcriptional regulator [Acetobacter syzygii]